MRKANQTMGNVFFFSLQMFSTLGTKSVLLSSLQFYQPLDDHVRRENTHKTVYGLLEYNNKN